MEGSQEKSNEDNNSNMNLKNQVEYIKVIDGTNFIENNTSFQQGSDFNNSPYLFNVPSKGENEINDLYLSEKPTKHKDYQLQEINSIKNSSNEYLTVGANANKSREKSANKILTKFNSKNSQKIEAASEDKSEGHHNMKRVPSKRKSILFKPEKNDSKHKPATLLKFFLRHFKRFEKVTISQFVDYDLFYTTSLSCLKYIIEGHTALGKTYKLARAKDVSTYLMRNCIRYLLILFI